MVSPIPQKVSLVQAVNQALHHAMAADDQTVLLGQDVARCGGVFRATEGLMERFGAERVMDTPLSESAIIGVSVGLAIGGFRPLAELQFSGFSYQAFHQIEQHVSRYCNRTRGQYPMSMVIRMPHGGGVRAFEHHSESRESYFIHTPGLKVIMPSTPQDAYGLLLSAVEDPDPVIFLEPTKLYRSAKAEMPDPDYHVAIGKAKVVHPGTDLSLIAYGTMMPVCLEVAHAFKDRYSLEVIDLRTLSPLDRSTLIDSIKKTGRAVVVHEAPRTLGLGAEISAILMESAFDYLKAPTVRVTGYDTQMPYFQLENFYIPNVQRVSQAVVDTMKY